MFKDSDVFVEIAEETAVDSVITTVTAIGIEHNTSIVYRLLGKDETFVVDEFSGDVILRRRLDCYEVRTMTTNFIIGSRAQNTF